MSIEVQRLGKAGGTRVRGSRSLSQRFRISGLDASRATQILLSAPLVGKDSLFGTRPGEEVQAADGARSLLAFSPAPGFRFDVHLRLATEGVFVVRLAQPQSTRPYLSGEFLWLLTDENRACLFEEEINTPTAVKYGCRPVTGRKLSLRRWLFFQVGHPRVMSQLTRNLAQLQPRQI